MPALPLMEKIIMWTFISLAADEFRLKDDKMVQDYIITSMVRLSDLLEKIEIKKDEETM